MNNSTLEQRAKRGRRLLGICLSSVLGVFVFVLIFGVLVMKRIGPNQIAAGLGILLVVGAVQGERVTRIMLGILLAVLSVGPGYFVVREVMSGHPSGWTPFVAVAGGVYISAAFVLLTFFDIRAHEIQKERARSGDGEWIAVDSEEAVVAPPVAPDSRAAFSKAESTSPAPSPPPRPPATTKLAQQFPLVCTACGRLSPAGATSCKKCGKPLPAIKAARQT